MRKECAVLHVMKHENVVQVVDSWETSDEICFVMEQIEVSWRGNMRSRNVDTLCISARLLPNCSSSYWPT